MLLLPLYSACSLILIAYNDVIKLMASPPQLEAEVTRLQGSVRDGREGHDEHHQHLEALSSRITKLSLQLQELEVGMKFFLSSLSFPVPVL